MTMYRAFRNISCGFWLAHYFIDLEQFSYDYKQRKARTAPSWLSVLCHVWNSLEISCCVNPWRAAAAPGGATFHTHTVSAPCGTHTNSGGECESSYLWKTYGTEVTLPWPCECHDFSLIRYQLCGKNTNSCAQYRSSCVEEIGIASARFVWLYEHSRTYGIHVVMDTSDAKENARAFFMHTCN